MARGLERTASRGQVSAEFDPRHVMLAMRSLTMFPTTPSNPAHHGAPLFRPKIPKGTRGIPEKICSGFSTTPIVRYRRNQFCQVNSMKNSILILGVIHGCGRRLFPQREKRPRAACLVLVATAFTTNVPVQIQPQPVGHVVPYSTVTIRLRGILKQVSFQEGAEVK